jgi:hypothetical protein
MARRRPAPGHATSRAGRGRAQPQRTRGPGPTANTPSERTQPQHSPPGPSRKRVSSHRRYATVIRHGLDRAPPCTPRVSSHRRYPTVIRHGPHRAPPARSACRVGLRIGGIRDTDLRHPPSGRWRPLRQQGPGLTTTSRPKAARHKVNRRRPTLPGPCEPSTIGAERLNCSVRNGKRCFPLAIATGNSRESRRPLKTAQLPQVSKSTVKPSTH